MGTDNSHGALVEARIDHICTMMRDMTFRTGKTVLELAKLWNLSRHTVYEYTNEASRRVLAEIKDPDRSQAKGLSQLEGMIDDSIADTVADRENSARHRKNAMDGIKILLELTGMAAAKRIKLEYDSLSEDELERRAAEIADKLARAITKKEV